MKEEMTMFIKEEELLGILKQYYSSLEEHDVTVKTNCHTVLEGFYENEVTKVEFVYEKNAKIGKFNATISVTLDEEDVKEVLSKVLPAYDIVDITFNTSINDYYGEKVLIGVNIRIKPKQMNHTL